MQKNMQKRNQKPSLIFEVPYLQCFSVYIVHFDSKSNNKISKILYFYEKYGKI